MVLDVSTYEITHLTAGVIFVILYLTIIGRIPICQLNRVFVTYKRDPFGIDKGPTIHEFGCDVKENTDTRLVVAFPKSRVLTPDVAVGQPGQVARFEFSKDTKKGKHHHGRRADVIFVA